MPRDRTREEIEQKESSVKCCVCGEHVLASGWCWNCRTWPINITPRRFHGHHLVDVDGFCWTCKTFELTRLEASNGEWRDTGVVSKLLSREENQRKLRSLMVRIPEGGGLTPISKGFQVEEAAEITQEPSSTQMSREEMQRQKDALARLAADEVPF